MNSYPRETVEFIPLTVLDGTTPVTAFQVAVTPVGVRPTAWAAAAVLDGARGVIISALTPGFYAIWAKVTASPETPVIQLGTIAIT